MVYRYLVMRFKVLVAYRHPSIEIFVNCLKDIADIDVEDLGREGVIERLKEGYDALITDLLLPVDSEVIDAGLPRLKVVGTFSIGLNHIDVDYALDNGVQVVNSAAGWVGASTYAVAEHAYALLLTLIRRTPLFREIAKSGSYSWWDLGASPSSPFMGDEIFNSVIGVIGGGRIGTHIARIGRGFGAKVLVYDPFVDRERVWEAGAEITELKELLSASQYVFIAAMLTKENDGMLGYDEVRVMKGAYLVNVSRGELVDENAVVEGLREGRIKGYGADVLAHEPPTVDTSPIYREFLKGKLNILITPHSAWLTGKAMERYARILARRVRESLTGEWLCEGDYNAPESAHVGNCPREVKVSRRC
jgi:D-3-phosphoglycerate dehydrogenase